MEAKYDFVRKYREQILQCSRCGFCQAVCPVYGTTLRPAYNARGKMLLLKEVMDGHIELNDELIETLFQCSTNSSFFNCIFFLSLQERYLLKYRHPTRNQLAMSGGIYLYITISLSPYFFNVGLF